MTAQRSAILPCLLLLFALPRSGAVAQVDRAEPKEPAAIHLVSDPEGAAVYWKDSLLGKTPIDLPFDREWGGVRLIYPDPGVWGAVEKQVEIGSTPRVAGIRRVVLPKRILLRSIPFGAEVLSGDSLLGTTPLRCTLEADSLPLLVRKGRYRSSRVTLNRTAGGEALVTLDPLLPDMGPGLVFQDKSPLPEPQFRVIAAGATGLAAGIASIALKRHADDLYDQYRTNGLQETLDRTRRYDIYAGIGYLLLQASLGYLIYLLLFD